MPMSLALVLVACASPPKENYYTLAAVAPAAAVATPHDLGVTVVTTGLVEAVDRPQLVLRLSDTRVQILEQKRWAEPLKAAIARVIAANLARELGSARVSSQSQTAIGDTGFRVALDVQRFDSIPDQGVAVGIAWTVRSALDATRTGRALVTERSERAGYEDLVAAHSRALANVSHDIAAAIAEMSR